MNKCAKYSFLILSIMVLIISGCGKKSGVEGKVVDSKGRPIAGLKVIAVQVQLIKGYEHFETITNSNGIFKFKKLYPSSDYILSVWHKDWKTNAETYLTTGPEGETIALKEPIQIWVAFNDQGMPIDPQTNSFQFAVSDNGIIFDSLNNLEWYAGPDEDISWNQAKAWCDNLSDAGGKWRLPKIAELKTLYIKGVGERNIVPLFKTTGQCFWTSEVFYPPRGDGMSIFDFKHGDDRGWNERYTSNEMRAFAVRTRK